MQYQKFDSFFKKTKLSNQNQIIFFDLFINRIFYKMDAFKVNERSFYNQNEESVILNFIHRQGGPEIKIKVDKFEVYIWIENFGYSAFQISKKENFSDEFFEDIICFLEYAFSGNFKQEFYYYKDELVKSRIIWKINKFPESIYMPLKHLFFEKLKIRKYKLKRIKEFPSFFSNDIDF